MNKLNQELNLNKLKMNPLSILRSEGEREMVGEEIRGESGG